MDENNDQYMEKRPLRAAAIGVGSLGRHHARNYSELTKEGRIEFAGNSAVVDDQQPIR